MGIQDKLANTRRPKNDTVYLLISDGPYLSDLCCFWTGFDLLPSRSERLNVMFNTSSDMELPMAESCFFNIVLPIVHSEFEQFKKKMDVALKYGSKGFCFA